MNILFIFLLLMDNNKNNNKNNKIKVQNKFKPKDNFESNRSKVNRENFKGKKGKRELQIAESKRNIILQKRKAKELLENKPTEIPSQLITKFISMEGKELNSESSTNEITLPSEITIFDLNKLINNLLKNPTKEIYNFYINDIEIKTNLKETLQQIKNFSGEKTYNIVYCPESLFKVKPLTRGSTILEGHTDSILTVQFSPNSNLLVSGGGDSNVKFWDMNTDTEININNENNIHNNWILSLTFSPDNSILVSADVDGCFLIWNAYEPFELKNKKCVKAHKKWIMNVCFKPLHLYNNNNENENYLKFITSGKDGYLKIWNANTGKIDISTLAHNQSITKVIWSGENKIYSCSEDMFVKVFDENLNNLNILSGHSHWINTMAINTEFILRTGCYDFENLNNINNNNNVYNFIEKIEKMTFIEKVNYSKKRYINFKKKINSSEKIVTGSDDFTLILWDINISNKPIIRMTGHQGIVNDVKFSPNAFYLASASFDKSIKIWNANNGNFLFNLRGHVLSVYQISWSPNSKMLLSGSKDSTLFVWNIDTKKRMFDLAGHADEVYTVDWAPNGNKAASGSKDRRVRIWVN